MPFGRLRRNALYSLLLPQGVAKLLIIWAASHHSRPGMATSKSHDRCAEYLLTKP